ncbi:TATA box-binding protein-associated factor, RNA polymerase I, subunit C isoform X1 [Hypanus sabinus]|uniref:TATA box-binding protein-associated factor, RNA polymerase I, subunit C isoform X1 n=2 Tax=Hypanus sabinus TaxID=79690 RepID=UPI0028C414B1|nr:TATA box-binding protein-associated factor, RNA polymerase I, subunit C isoform X1 [Hypanus sabinus]
MASAFPYSLFPSFYSPGPIAAQRQELGSCGKYEHVQPFVVETGDQQVSELKWSALRCLKRENWEPLEPVPIPLLPAKTGCKFRPVSLEELTYTGRIITGEKTEAMTMGPLNFTEQMANFFLDHSNDAFSSMGKLLEEHFYFGESVLRGNARKTAVNVNHLRVFTERVKKRGCPLSSASKHARLLNLLLRESIFDIPPDLLAENIHEEMKIQRNKLLFDHSATGGALVYCPFSKGANSEDGCLIYPGSNSMNLLNFHKVALSYDQDKMPKLNVKFKPVKFELKGRIHQINASALEEEVFVGVRSDYHCGAWKLSNEINPAALQVVQTEKVATCINVSPHVPGELVIASECGAAYLWVLDKGLQKIRKETENLYFNAQLPWRWCDFTAHPRVYMYADRTGLDLTDVRAGESYNQTLFKIGAAADCQKGERVILPKHLRDVNPYHHLITTQYSVYIVDERFSTVPVLKWDHTLDSPPMFVQIANGAVRNRTNKIVLGTQRTQEVLLLQYSGGTQMPCQSFGPPQKLSTIYDIMQHLPVRRPHLHEMVAERLHSAGAGLATLYHTRGKKTLSVFQLSAAGDLFYQTLIPQNLSANGKRTLKESGTIAESEHEPNSATVGERVQSVNCGTEPSHDEAQDLIPGGSERQEEASSLRAVDKPRFQSSIKQSTKTPLTPSSATLVMCRRWMNSFLKKQQKFRNGCEEPQKHSVISTKRLFSHKTFLNDNELNDTYKEMWNKMKVVMQRKQVLCQNTFPILDPVSVPDVVDPSVWRDELSERLTASWEGKWNDWWAEKLDVNRDKKVRALRARRRLEKLSRAGRRRELSGSFTSSVSNLSDFSDFSGWSRSSVLDSEQSDYLSGAESNVLSKKSLEVSNQIVNENFGQEVDLQSSVSVVEQNQPPTPTFPQERQLVSIPKERKRILQNYLAALEDLPPQSAQGDDGIDGSLPLAISTQLSHVGSLQMASTSEMSFLPMLRSQPGSSQPKRKRARMGF